MKKILMGILAIPMLAFLAPFAIAFGAVLYFLLYALFFAGAVSLVIIIMLLMGYGS